MNRLTHNYFMKHDGLYDAKYMGFDVVDLYNKLKRLEDIEEEFLKYNIDMTSFLKQVLDELKQQPTLEINNFNPEFKILRNDLIKVINEYAKVELKNEI